MRLSFTEAPDITAATRQPRLRRTISPQPAVSISQRPVARGKFLFLGDKKFYLRGVTYGTFRPSAEGEEFHQPDKIERDFSLMATEGINAVRTYTVPPRWFLDIAQRHGLFVMVGLPWEQHITFLDSHKRRNGIEEIVRRGVAQCAGHPAVLCYVIGNEIPSSIVRWHGRRRVEKFLERLYRIAKQTDPAGLVTYVNFPPTEYLQLPFLDLVCFNIYLESQPRLDGYLARLQNIAGTRPLVMAELGLDSRRNGREQQAQVLEWQIQTTFEAGCAGVMVFSWTDEWFRGGHEIEDWDFGITDRARQPKPALEAVRRAFARVPFAPEGRWPRITVVVCVYNGARTIRECLDGLQRLKYPDFEIIVVNDGSRDGTTDLIRDYHVRVIQTRNNGLSSARNSGLQAATGEIVAYIDSDAYPDPDWLTYLAATFRSGRFSGVGGPNIAPAGDHPIAQCVSFAPGGPVHVLLSDREAEHVPGCNMAFRTEDLRAIGGFDTRFRIAGDDVDVCWQLQQRGWRLGFSPAAMVWHHCRDSISGYWRQQLNYGKAEAMLERKWPEKYNHFGHLTWKGRLYSNGFSKSLPLRSWRVYHGVWGSGLFQSIYEPAPGTIWWLPLMPEWYLVIFATFLLSALGILWSPLLFALPALLLSTGIVIIQAVLSTSHISIREWPRKGTDALRFRLLTIWLHLIQPLSRLMGRLSFGLRPWRRRGKGFAYPHRRVSFWSEVWDHPYEKLRLIEAELRAEGALVCRGGDFCLWDLEIWGGLLGGIRFRMAVEDHGSNKQLIRFKVWPYVSIPVIITVSSAVVLSTLSGLFGFTVASLAAGVIALGLVGRLIQESSTAMAATQRTFTKMLGKPLS